MNLIIKRQGQADKIVTVTLGDLIFEEGRLSLQVNGPAGKTYLVPLIPGPIPKPTEDLT